MPKYRIVEFKSKEPSYFKIEIYGYEVTGILWWKKKIWSWGDTNMWGGARSNFPIVQPRSKLFGSLAEAQNQIYKWNNPPEKIIHEETYSG